MNKWERLPLGEIFSIEKGSLQSTECTPGKFTFITASSEWKTHNDYSHDCEALVYAVAASGSLGRCHHYNGKFISSDLCFILRAKDETKRPINYQFYQNVFKFLRNDIVSKTKAGTSKESISQKRLSSYYLPYIDIDHQEYWEIKLNNLNSTSENLETESIEQSSYLTQLRQAILQEAVEGKLTADWRKENPVRKGDPDYDAEALLEKIKAEKEKLVKEGKIKKQKSLAPIKTEEVPFELPEGWVWTRLGEVAELITSGSRDWAKYYSDNGRAKFLRMGNLSHEWFDLREKYQFVNPPVSGEGTRTSLIKDDLLISITGDVGWKALIPEDFGEAYINQHTAMIRFVNFQRGLFFPIVLCSPFSWKQFRSPQRGIKNSFRLTDVSEHIVPLPPLAEQQAIVERVEKLLSMVDELKKQVTERKEQSEQLMQSVLWEAFEGG